MLKVAGIHFSYKIRPALRDIHFHLPPGRLMGVLGVNGAGKSTLLKCINRILKPQTGTVYLEDLDITHADPRRIAQVLGYVPQRHGKSPLTVYESVLLGRRPHMGWGVSTSDYAMVESVLNQLGLSTLARRPVMEISGGEVQKVMLARALAQKPKVLLLDEPTSNLDLKNQMEVMGLIRDIVKNQNISVVVSIHDLNLAVRFADLFLFLKNHAVHTLVDREHLNEAMIKDVYGVEGMIREISGRVVVVPV